MTSRGPRVFVSVGTHEQGFPRLISAVTRLAADNSEGVEWVVQTGNAVSALPEHVKAFAFCPYDEILAYLDWADVSISGCSPGSVFGAIARRAVPIVVPRQHALGEHVDDHQLKFGDYLVRHQMAAVVTDIDQLEATVTAAAAEPQQIRVGRLEAIELASRARTRSWAQLVGDEIESLASAPSRRNWPGIGRWRP